MKILSVPLVQFPEVAAGRDGTQVWLLAHFMRKLNDIDDYIPLEMTQSLLFPVDRFVGLDISWARHQQLYAEYQHRAETEIKTEYLTAYEKSGLEASYPYLSISTITHPLLNRPLVMARSLFGFFLIGTTPCSYTDWCCQFDDLTEDGKAFYDRIGQVHPHTQLTLLTLRGTEPLVPLVRTDDYQKGFVPYYPMRVARLVEWCAFYSPETKILTENLVRSWYDLGEALDREYQFRTENGYPTEEIEDAIGWYTTWSRILAERSNESHAERPVPPVEPSIETG